MDIVRRIHPLFLLLAGVGIIVFPYVVGLLIDGGERKRPRPEPSPVVAEEETPYLTFTSDRPGETMGAVSGRVIGKLGMPVHGARVKVSVFGEQRSTETDENGEFLLDALPSGIHALGIEADIEDRRIVRVDAGAEVRAGHTTRLTAPIDLSKVHSWSIRPMPDGPEPRATLSGRVTDEEDRPLPGVAVVVWPGTSLFDPKSAIRCETDEEGAFSLEVPEGDLGLWAVSKTHLPECAQAWVYRSREVTIRLRRGVTLSGVVVDEHDRPIPDALVKAEQDSPARNVLRFLGIRPVRSTRIDGRFAFDALAPDRPVDLDISTTERGRRRISALRADRQDLVVRMGPVGFIEGHVALDGKPIAVRVSGQGPGPDDWSSADSDPATGCFRLGPIPAGAWTLHAEIDEGVTRATRDVFVRADETVVGFDMVLDRGPDLGIVGRLLLPNENADSGLLSWWDVAITGPVGRWAQTDEHGRFVVRGLVPGVYVAEGPYGGRSAPFRVPRQAEVVIGPEGIREVELDVDVVDARGGSLRWARVLHLRSGDGFHPDAAQFGVADTVPAGRHGFVLLDPRRADPWSGTPVVVDLEPEDSRSVELVDEVPRANLRGRLLLPDAGPLGFETVMLVRRSAFVEGGLLLGGGGVLDTAGWFEIASVPLGRYFVKLLPLDGYEHTTVGRINLEEQGNVTCELKLRAGVVSGRVVEPDSDRPVPWARVFLSRIRDAEVPSDRFDVESSATITDEDGAFAIRYLPKGRYAIGLAAAHRATAFVGEVVVDGREGPSLLLEASQGAVARIDLLREDGAPADGGRLCVLDEAGRYVRFSRPFAWGNPSIEAWSSMRIRLLPGRYSLRAQAPGHAAVEQALHVTPSGAHVRVVVAAGAAARVRVVDVDGPVPNARIRVMHPDGAPILRVPRPLDVPHDHTGHRTSMTGRVLVDELPAGRLRFVADTGDGRRGEVVCDVTKASLFDVTITLK